MPIPPPPAAAPRDIARDELVAELGQLETPELLALCLRFRREPERLGLYLSVLRRRGGDRAQFAACLVCFDMARLGVATAQQEFAALAPTMTALSQDQRLVQGLLHDDPYLTGIWAEAVRALAEGDAGASGGMELEAEVVGELDLLSAEDVADLSFDEPVDRGLAQAQAAYATYVREYLDHRPETGAIRVGRAFATDGSEELERIELFVMELAGHFSQVPDARALASLGSLYLGMHLRARNLFGRPNPRRVTALRRGLLNIPEDMGALARAAEIFAFEGRTVVRSFEKVLELVVDYVRFCYRERLHPREPQSVETYLALDRRAPSLDRVASGRS